TSQDGVRQPAMPWPSVSPVSERKKRWLYRTAYRRTSPSSTSKLRVRKIPGLTPKSIVREAETLEIGAVRRRVPERTMPVVGSLKDRVPTSTKRSLQRISFFFVV